MSGLKKVDPKFFTEEWLKAANASVVKWEDVVRDSSYDSLVKCGFCDHSLVFGRIGTTDCGEWCPLGQAHPDGSNCCSHFEPGSEIGYEDHDALDALLLLIHLREIRNQIKRGLEEPEA